MKNKMELEYINLKDFLKESTYLKKGDYLYEHDKSTYPLKSEFNSTNLYFVTENKNHLLKIQNMANRKVLDIDLNSLHEKWWVLPLPPFVRNKIGLD